MTTIDPATLDAVAHGSHHDPHSVLGIHPAGKNTWVIRTRRPLAATVTAVFDGGKRVRLEHVAAGIWEGTVTGPIGSYRIDATYDGVKKEKVVVEKVVAGRRIDRIDVACGDAVATAKTAARRAARRKRRALEDFERLLDASRRASRSKTTWEDAERRLRDAPEWRRCCGDGGERGEYLEDAKALFAARAVRLAAREAEARAAMEEGEALRLELWLASGLQIRPVRDRRHQAFGLHRHLPDHNTTTQRVGQEYRRRKRW
mgnify:CR=1 FL=1